MQSKKSGRPKKPPKTYIGKNQLKELLDKPNLSIEDIAKKLRTTQDIIRRYIDRYRL